MPNSKEYQAQLLAKVAQEAEWQYVVSEDYSDALPWNGLDDLNQQVWALKACGALSISPEQWRSAVNICRTPGQSVKLLLGEMRLLYP